MMKACILEKPAPVENRPLKYTEIDFNVLQFRTRKISRLNCETKSIFRNFLFYRFNSSLKKGMSERNANCALSLLIQAIAVFFGG